MRGSSLSVVGTPCTRPSLSWLVHDIRLVILSIVIPVRVTFNILSGNKLYICQSSTILVKSQNRTHTYYYTTTVVLYTHLLPPQENLVLCILIKRASDETGINITGAIMFDYEEFQLE